MIKEFHIVIKIIAILSIFLTALQAQEMRNATMGYLTDGMNDIKYKDTRIAFSMWLEDLATKEFMDINMVYYDSSMNIVNDFINYELDYLTLNPIFYLKNQKIIDPWAEEFWVVNKGKNQLESYLILVREDSDIKTLKDLKNKSVGTREDNYLGKMYLESELLQVRRKYSRNYFKGYINTGKFSTAILNTFFGKVDACIVPSYTLDLVSEMNPSIKKSLRVIKRSEEIFFPILAIFHINTQRKIIDDFALSVKGLKESPRGRNILNLFKMEGLRRISKEKIAPMKEYYNNYLGLRKKYVK